ncbi:killer cell lectin-like receptor 3 [Macrotis lagotis]|uniref:killer cell lectin-like receptor 3 n=1 Tax=Macrotis lagotis TaxID=92651 RepID=UPI003D690E66
MEESSIMNLSNSQEKSEVEQPMNDPEQETSTLVAPLPPSAEPENEWGPIPNELFIKDVPDTRSPWAVIVVILGMLSLLLMITTAFFCYQYFQNEQESARRMDDLIKVSVSFHNKVENFTESMKKIQEDILENQKIQFKKFFDILKMQKVNQGNHSQPCLKNWNQCKDDCYHQTLKDGLWFNCSDLCISMNSTFLQLGTDMLMDSMKIFVLNETYIGVVYQKDSNEWKWIDGSSCPFLASSKTEQNFGDSCAFINPCTVNFYQCNKILPCMCEKKTLSPES